MKSLLTSYYNRLSMKADQVVCNANTRQSQRELRFGRQVTKRMSLHEPSSRAGAGDEMSNTIEKHVAEPAIEVDDRQEEEEIECQTGAYDFATSIKFIDDNDSADLSNTSGEDLLTEAPNGHDYVETFGRKRHDMSSSTASGPCKCEHRVHLNTAGRSFYKDQMENYDNSKLKFYFIILSPPHPTPNPTE